MIFEFGNMELFFRLIFFIWILFVLKLVFFIIIFILLERVKVVVLKMLFFDFEIILLFFGVLVIKGLFDILFM